MIGADCVAGMPATAALPALARVSERLLRGALGNADALQADGEPRAIHHREHRAHAGILFADDKPVAPP